MTTRLARALLVALPCPVSAAQQVWIVDDDGGAGVGFQNAQDAVAAAQDGEIFVGLHAPLLPSGVESLTAFAQVALVNSSGASVTNGATLLLLDAPL